MSVSDNDSSWETEIEEDFEIVSGYAEDQLAHDDAGNLTYDGLHQYTYDAWNRLTAAWYDANDDGGLDESPTDTAVATYASVTSAR